jgi:hypothetical protein
MPRYCSSIWQSNQSSCVRIEGAHIIALVALSFLAFQVFVERILAELLDLPPMRWRARLRQFPRMVTRSSLRRGVREEPIEVAADESFLLAGSRPLDREIVSTFL